MSWPPDLDAVTSYLRTQDVIKALHVNSQKNTGWQECKSAVGRAFTAKGSKPSVELLPGILEEVPVLLFSGDKDLLCNHIGTERLIGNLTWNGAQGFETSEGSAPQRKWHFEGETAGYWQDARNLTYVLFYESSHMVPVDWPRRSRDMLDRFMQVDTRSVGGIPFDSQLDGEPNLSNGTFTRPSHDDTQKQLEDAKWAAYQNSGGAVLIIIIIVVAVWGFAVWRGRRKQPAYQALSGNENRDGASGLEGFRRKRGQGDLEAAAFDESELDDLHLETPTQGNSKYSVGEDSDDDEEQPKTKAEKSSR
jgi:carboxypeptidase D